MCKFCKHYLLKPNKFFTLLYDNPVRNLSIKKAYLIIFASNNSIWKTNSNEFNSIKIICLKNGIKNIQSIFNNYLLSK